MREERTYYVYILASKPYGTLYIGVSGNFINRMEHHRAMKIQGFTKRYGVTKLVHFEMFGEVTAAIQREKTMKKWPRQWKINLIERDNPHWNDLYQELSGERGIQPIHGLPGQARQ